jgi:hypothetical protein
LSKEEVIEPIKVEQSPKIFQKKEEKVNGEDVDQPTRKAKP